MTSSNAYRSLLFGICMLFVLSDVIPEVDAAFSDNQLYVSNASHILSVNLGTGKGTPVYTAPTGGRIVGLAYSLADGMLFWSDIGRFNRAIYSATTDGFGKLINVTQIVTSDVLEVNGLAVDWISKHIYWTDGRKRTVEVAEFNGANRRVLFFDLNQPRGIYADPINKYLYWNDQGSHQIEKSYLDGSSRSVLVSDNVVRLPNQMVVSAGKLYWVDSGDKTLRSVSVNDGSNLQTVQLSATTGNNHVFGLAISSGTAYITCWSSTAQLLTVNLSSGTVHVLSNTPNSLGSSAVFNAVFISSNVQASARSPCAGSPCQQGQLCLPTASGVRCSCPSYGGKTLNDATGACQTPTNVLLYTLADSGFVGFFDPAARKNGDYYFIARSLRPVAVTYDPVNQNVYWSDVSERTIHRSKLDGTYSTIILDSSDGIGIVDGMALDYVGKRLVYSNIGSVKIEGNTYSWHKVESVNIDRLPYIVKTLVSSIADKPRAVAIDVNNAVFYYTDWGSKASIVRANLDGSSATVLKTGLFNPNGIVFTNGKLYVVDSNYKTRVSKLGSEMYGKLYSVESNGNNWRELTLSGEVKTPFGVTSDNGNTVYVSDWDSKSVISYDISQSNASPDKVLQGASPMALHYSVVTLSPPPPRANSCSTCENICLPSSTRSSVCACNSYKGKALAGNTCSVPSGYLAVSDMDGVKIVSLDDTTDKSVYVAAAGRPFYSNFVGLVLDTASNKAYYSDLTSKTIYSLNMLNSTSTAFYRVNHAIDGMTLDRGILYWTDSRNGLIAYLDTNSNANIDNRTHTTLLSGLSRPRAIKVSNSYIYWTEWGDNPRVSRMPLHGPFIAKQLPTPALKWPNALFITGDRMFVGDGHPSQRQLLNCSLDGTNCRPVAAVNNANVQHIYDLQILNNVMYYSEWNTSTISALSLDNNGTPLQPIAAGFVRPAQFQFFTKPSTRGIGTSSSCSSTTVSCSSTGSCIQLLGSQQCVCNSGSSFNGSTCISSQSASCGTYNVGQVFKPTNQPCVTCQCLANRFYADPSNSQATCNTVQCPVLNCSNQLTPTDQCCPVCPDAPRCSGIRISNCPSSPLSISLPGSSSRVVYELDPTYEDCRQLSRNVRVTKDPVDNLFVVGTHSLKIVVSAETDSDQCQFMLNVIDDIAPTIRCPDTVQVYTDSSSVNVASAVKWQAPEVNDNAGRPTVTSSPAWGSNFIEGQQVVTYTATDNSGNRATCSFKVEVTRPPQAQPGVVCPIPRLENGLIKCGIQGSSLVCSITCDPTFTRSSKTVAGDLTCNDGKWNLLIPENFATFTCLRVVEGTATGAIGVVASGICSGSPNLDYTNFRLKMQIAEKYKSYSQFPLRPAVQSACANNNLEITVSVSGDYQNETDKRNVEQDINFILRDIEKNLKTGFLEVFVRNDTNIWSAPNISVSTRGTTSDCPIGSYSEPGVGCVYCPAGTYKPTSVNTCQNCEKGSYSDQEGQVTCTKCPDGRTTNVTGASIVDLCNIYQSPEDMYKPGDDQSIPIVPIAVGVGILAIVIIIIIIVIVVQRRKQQQHQLPTTGAVSSTKHDNKAFAENKEDTYDEIPFDGAAATADPAENKYETLPHTSHGNAAAEKENVYEKMALSDPEPDQHDLYLKPVYTA